MAIHDSQNNNTQQQAPQPAQATPAQGQPSAMSQAFAQAGAAVPPQGNQTANNFAGNATQPGGDNRMHADGTFNWHDPNTFFSNYTLNSSRSAVSLEKAYKAFKDVLEEREISPDFNVSLFQMDKGNSYGLGVSCLVFALDSDKLPGKMAYYTLLIEGSIDALPNTTVTVQNRQVEVFHLTSDLYNHDMVNIIRREVARRFGNDKTYYNGDAQVLPRYFDLECKEYISDVIMTVATACRRQLMIADDNFIDLNLSRARPGSILNQAIKTGTAHELDMAGDPVRADIILTTVGAPIVNDRQPIDNQSPISHATGYIDLQYINNDNPYMYQAAAIPGYPQQLPKYYQPNFVITQLSPAITQTTPGVLLALINASFIRENINYWLPTLLPNPVANKKNNTTILNDIGNIGYDVPLVQADGTTTFAKINTNPAEFTYADLLQLYYRYFDTKGLTISLDIPECGPLSWLYKDIARAASGSIDARGQLLHAANILTNGNFDRHYKNMNGNGVYAYYDQNRVLLGYYDAPDGKRDIRDLSYLAVAGLLGQKNRDEIADYTDTFDLRLPVESRMEFRKAITDSLLNNPVYTGFAQRITFEPAFISALVAGALDCGYHVSPAQAWNGTFEHTRGTSAWVMGGVLEANTSGIFTNPVSGMGQQYGMIPNRFAQ